MIASVAARCLAIVSGVGSAAAASLDGTVKSQGLFTFAQSRFEGTEMERHDKRWPHAQRITSGAFTTIVVSVAASLFASLRTQQRWFVEVRRRLMTRVRASSGAVVGGLRIAADVGRRWTGRTWALVAGRETAICGRRRSGQQMWRGGTWMVTWGRSDDWRMSVDCWGRRRRSWTATVTAGSYEAARSDVDRRAGQETGRSWRIVEGIVAVASAGRIERIVLKEALDSQGFGHFEERRKLLLGDVDLTPVHVLENGADLGVLDIFEDDDGMRAGILQEQRLEVRGTSGQHHLVAFDGSAAHCQRHIRKGFRLKQLLKDGQQIGAMIVPAKTVLLAVILLLLRPASAQTLCRHGGGGGGGGRCGISPTLPGCCCSSRSGCVLGRDSLNGHFSTTTSSPPAAATATTSIPLFRIVGTVMLSISLKFFFNGSMTHHVSAKRTTTFKWRIREKPVFSDLIITQR